MAETDDQLARRLLSDVLNGEVKWTPDMRLRIATVAQAYASLAIVTELRRSNEDRALFNATMREFFERLIEQPGNEGSLRSGQPAAAPDGQEGGKP